MSLRLLANLNCLFKEAGGIENRILAAKNAGFSGVEISFPYEVPVEKLAAAKEKAGVEVHLLNAHPGKGWNPANLASGDVGIAALPHRYKDFSELLDISLTYAKALGCKAMHVMSGMRPSQLIDTGMEACYLENLKTAADRLQQEGILCLIEPINTFSMERYFMDSPKKAVEYIKKLNHSNLKMQLDLFHLQMTEGCLTKHIDEYLPYVGHVQIAQAPDRHEPNTEGEINYKYVLDYLQKAGYHGTVGCEYFPKGKTEDGLGWIQEMGLSL